MSEAGGERASWVVVPSDPRAPPTRVWLAMSAAERATVVAALPSELPVDAGAPPEGDEHYDAADAPRKTLRRYFDRLGRKAYVGTNLPVYYPDEPMFSPDVFVVLDVEPHDRLRWVVDDEARGLDLALEVHVGGDWRKDFVANVARYARLGIREYFAFSLKRGVLVGYRLGPGGSYEPLALRGSAYESEALGLELQVEGRRVRFLNRDAPLPDLDELVSRLERAMGDATTRLLELERDLEAEQKAREAEQKAREAEQKAREVEQKAREAAEARIAQLEAELAALRRRPRE